MELWSPPRDAPHLFEWWRPLVQVSRRARLERYPWPVHVDEFRLAGRAMRKGRPDVWIYEHHENNGSLCVDSQGRTYRFVATPRGEGVGQFRPCDLATALRRAGLPEVVPRVWYQPPAAPAAPAGRPGGAEGGPGHPARGDRSGAAARSAGGAPGAPAGATERRERPAVRRRHLTLVAG